MKVRAFGGDGGGGLFRGVPVQYESCTAVGKLHLL